MPGVLLWGWDDTNKKWIKVEVDTEGRLQIVSAIAELGDIGDVTIAALADGHFIVWSDGLGYWQNRALAEGDIPAEIARDTEVATAVSDHADLDTGVHGAGAHTLLNSGDGKLYNPITPIIVYDLYDGVSASPRTATVSSIATDTITLTANEAYRFWHTNMNGNVYLKITNTTKVEDAWVKAIPAVNQLQVTVAGDISGWENGDTISTNQYIELDLSASGDIPAGATAIFAMLKAKDSGTIANNKGLIVRQEAGFLDLSVLVQVSGITISVYSILGITASLHCDVRDAATGVDTLFPILIVMGYFS